MTIDVVNVSTLTVVYNGECHKRRRTMGVRDKPFVKPSKQSYNR